MTQLLRALSQHRFILSAATVLAILGLMAWATMPREEDPQFPKRNGIITVTFPGADAETMERLVVEPLEEALAEVENLKEINSTARSNVALTTIEMADQVYDTDSVWDDVEDAMEKARLDFPQEVNAPILNDDLSSQEAVILTLSGSRDPLRLLREARELKHDLLQLPMTKEVVILGDPGEQITVEYDENTARSLGVSPRHMAAILGQRTSVTPGGFIRTGEKMATLKPQTDFASLDDILATSIPLPSGSSVPLSSIATVRMGPREPQEELFRYDGHRTVGLSIIPRDSLNRIEFGRQVRSYLDTIRPEIEPIEIHEVVFQPDEVHSRLSDLTRSLLLGIGIVAAILFLTMGMRMGLLVASVVPLVAIGSIGLFAAGGGILHQISISAVVIALGMLVDNAIVMAEGIQYRLDQGQEISAASLDTVKELALPLGSATGTTLAAFVPMLLSKGGTADFTRAIPILIMLTLVMSYLFAVFVTPTLAHYLLKRRPENQQPRSFPLWDRSIRGMVHRPWAVLGGVTAIFVVTLLMGGLVKQQFFPAADRPLAIVELEMPEGTHIEETDALVAEIETALGESSEVESVTSFVGRAAPHFYYNLVPRPNSPHRADLLVQMRSLEKLPATMEFARHTVRQGWPRAEVVVRRLEQGPPITAPVEVLLQGPNLEDLREAAENVLGQFRAHQDLRDARTSLGLGVPTLQFDLDDAGAARFGLGRQDIALALLGRSLGLEVGQYRGGDDPIPLVVRSREGDRFPAGRLAGVDVSAPGGSPVPLDQVSSMSLQWKPAAIHHLNGERIIRVQAQIAEGTTAAAILKDLKPQLESIEIPSSVHLAWGGEQAESGEANSAILAAMPIGMLMLLGFLLAEFNSFRRIAIILATIPLAAIGVIPGLILSGQPFGFMAFLGIFALVGIVVNNAIVLVDVIDRYREEGRGLDEALIRAVKRRTRPILLTMATTVAGLSPLAFSSTTLWPPLAWTMISGLMASTLFTLLAIPALYKVIFQKKASGLPTPEGLAVAALVFCLWLPPLAAQETTASITMEEAMTLAADRPASFAAIRRADSAEALALTQRRATFWPSVGLATDQTWRDEGVALDTPLGPFDLGGKNVKTLGVELTQNLFNPSEMLFRVPARRWEAQAARQGGSRELHQLRVAAGEAWLRVAEIDAQLESTRVYLASLRSHEREVHRMVELGRLIKSDQLKIQLSRERAELGEETLVSQREVALNALARAVGFDQVEIRSSHGKPSTFKPPPIEALWESALEREDLEALRHKLQGTQLEVKAIRAEVLPGLVAKVRYARTDGDPFRPEESSEGLLQLKWTPFASGTRASRRTAKQAEADALRADLEDAEAGVRLEVQSALTEWRLANRRIEVASQGMALAEETLRIENARYAAGRSTTNDLLDAEADLQNQRTDLGLAILGRERARIQLSLAVGGESI